MSGILTGCGSILGSGAGSGNGASSGGGVISGDGASPGNELLSDFFNAPLADFAGQRMQSPKLS